MHKYDWSNVDSRLCFLATDCDGLVYGFTHKPKLTDWGFAPTNGFSKQVYGACCGFGFNKEWRESLEERPKEPAMSEFKAGDWVKTQGHSGLMIIYKVTGEKAIVDVISRTGKSIGLSGYKLSEIEHASEDEIKAGHRIDHILQEGNMVHDLGDDSPIENHISPNCQSREV